MRAIYKAPGEPAEMVDIENTLEALQGAVGGNIEAVTVLPGLCVICNEEGRLKGLERNITVNGVSFVGPVLFVGTDGEEFTDVPGEEVTA